MVQKFLYRWSKKARRCARALASHYVMIPVLQGLRKDHKADRNGDPNLGPKLRPLCAANKAPSAAFGGVVAKTVKAIADNVVKEGKGEVISTEEMKRLIEDSNKTRQSKSSREQPVIQNWFYLVISSGWSQFRIINCQYFQWMSQRCIHQ